MDVGQRILDLIKIKGPIIPSQISKQIGLDILMTSAYLSDLASGGKLKISILKVGGTPLYYLSGQESLLQNFSQNLHEKEKKAFLLLKEKKILRDNELEPVIRVALRQIKDFAVPLNVTHQDNTEIFWKWHLLGKDEVSSLIESSLDKKLYQKEAELKKISKEGSQKTEKDLKEIVSLKEIKEGKIEKEEAKKEIKKPIGEKPKEIKRFVDKTDSFLAEISSYFNKNKVGIKNTEILRKSSEIDFIAEIPSGIGILEYYCKAKNKKRISESDLSSAYIQGQLKKLPVLFLAKGELTKRAKEMMNKEFKSITINKL